MIRLKNAPGTPDPLEMPVPELLLLAEHKNQPVGFSVTLPDFNEAIRLDPTKAEYYFKRGIAYEKTKDFKKASESFATAIEFDKKHAGAYRHMAAAMKSLNRPQSAIEYQQKADELAPPKKTK